MTAAALIEARRLSKVFPMGGGPVHALREVSLEIAHGEYLAIRGPSGCGKSTLLHLLGCVDTATSGTLLFDGSDVGTLKDAARSDLRLRSIGFVFQRFFLLPMLTAAENVDVPQAEAGVPRNERRRRTAELLDYVGLSHRASHRPSQLSGGEAQRVAIARALANQPRLLLADEPTGELDRSNGEHIAELLDRVQADGTTVVVVTHDATLAERAARRLIMRDGQIEGEEAGS
jgi:putative ABC transport system ATP-binding protein